MSTSHRQRILYPRSACAAAALAFAAACAAACAGEAPAPRPDAYTPRTREVTVTTVPLLVKEQSSLYPFLKPAFAKGGVLDGKEVYAFVPSTIVAVAGDTLHLTIVNPEDDAHSFVLADFAVSLPGGVTTTATYVTKAAGIYPFQCAVPGHLPMMSGELVVLAPAAVAGTGGTAASLPAYGAR